MFNGPEWTRTVKNLLFKGDFAAVEEMIYQDVRNFPTGEHNRIRQMRGLYTSIKNIDQRSVPAEFEPVKLRAAENEAIFLDKYPDSFNDLPAGFYRIGEQVERESTFEADLSGLSRSELRRLREARFGLGMQGGTSDSFRVVENAFVCGCDLMMHAYAFSENLYVNEESGRIAKSYPMNFRVPAKRTIPHALLLPIPHHSGNYYHVLGEMVYGLRYAKLVGDAPILYQEDKYRILPVVCDRLGIDKNRLISIDEASDLNIQKALLPSHPPYYWNKSVFSFFQKISTRTVKDGLKVFISRRRSNRGPSNEDELETFLAERGFLVVYAELLSFEQQVLIASNTDVLVSVHGAGLANMAFMKAGAAMFELFPSEMLTRDFYMRSRHNDMAYSAMIFDKSVDMDVFATRLAKIVQ